MPFTFAHPAIVLPLRKLPKHWFSLTGLIIGSITPDFEYFIRMKIKSVYSHSIAGLFWFDLPLGVMLLLIYQILVKDKLIDHLPLWLNNRFYRYKGRAFKLSFEGCVVIGISILIGAASHLLWDSFTHPLGYFVHVIAWLRKSVIVAGKPLLIYNLLQHLSTLLGLAFIVINVLLLPAGNNSSVGPASKYWLIVIAVAGVVSVVRLLTGLTINQYGNVVVTAISSALLGLVVASACVKSLYNN